MQAAPGVREATPDASAIRCQLGFRPQAVECEGRLQGFPAALGPTARTATNLVHESHGETPALAVIELRNYAVHRYAYEALALECASCSAMSSMPVIASALSTHF